VQPHPQSAPRQRKGGGAARDPAADNDHLGRTAEGAREQRSPRLGEPPRHGHAPMLLRGRGRPVHTSVRDDAALELERRQSARDGTDVEARRADELVGRR
jgi:hypothetical protein